MSLSSTIFMHGKGNKYSTHVISCGRKLNTHSEFLKIRSSHENKKHFAGIGVSLQKKLGVPDGTTVAGANQKAQAVKDA